MLLHSSHIPPWGVVILHIDHDVRRSQTPMCKTIPQGAQPTLQGGIYNYLGNITVQERYGQDVAWVTCLICYIQD